MTNDTKKKDGAWTPEQMPDDFSNTRMAAAACLYAEHFEPRQDMEMLQNLIGEIYPGADWATVCDIVRKDGNFKYIDDELLDEYIAATQTDGYEPIAWRDAVIRILAVDFLAAIKTPSAQLAEDAIGRITDILDDRLRGTTKNAAQILSGQRTRMRKTMRALIVAALYIRNYRQNASENEMRTDLYSLVRKCRETDFIIDDFPFDEFLDHDGTVNARGRFVIDKAVRTVCCILPNLDKIDKIIQNSSRNWRVSRMACIDLNILRLATFELMIEKASTPRSLINEAIELAKSYSTEQSKKFVNGILQQICTDNHIKIG